MSLTFIKKFGFGQSGTAPVEEEPTRTRVMGLHGNVRLHSEFGLVPIALMRRGDKLKTMNGDMVRIVAVDGFRFDHAMMEARPDLRPIRIEAGALGAGLPHEDVVVAPDQLLGGDPARMGNSLVPASDLMDRPGVSRAPATETGYYQPRLERSAVLLAEGLRIRA